MSLGPEPRPESDGEFDYRGNLISRGLGTLVPNWLAKRAINVSITTDSEVYDRGESVSFTVAFTNRLPVAVTVPTPTQQRWGWTVDGHLEGSTERRFLSETPATFSFRAGQTRRISLEWNGRIRYTEPRHESRVPDSGEHELTAFLATENRPADSTTITLR